MSGILYIVATPIGNLGDMTFRAVEVLKAVALIAAEDTRQTAKLCQRYGIDTPLESYHDYNKEKRAPGLVRKLGEGADIAVVSDAGTPGISDPAFYLVREALKRNIQVVPLPGACSPIAALVASGLPTDRFSFEGFLPNKTGKRKNVLEKLKGREQTLIFFESPYRLVKTLADIKEVLGEVQVVVGRELTKKFEEFIRGPVSRVEEHFTKKTPKGEVVVLVNQKPV